MFKSFTILSGLAILSLMSAAALGQVSAAPGVTAGAASVAQGTPGHLPTYSSSGTQLGSSTFYQFLNNAYVPSTNAQGGSDYCYAMHSATLQNLYALIMVDFPATDLGCGTNPIANAQYGDANSFSGSIFLGPNQYYHLYGLVSTWLQSTQVDIYGLAGQGNPSQGSGHGNDIIGACNNASQAFCNGSAGAHSTLPPSDVILPLTSDTCSSGTCTFTPTNGTAFVSGEVVFFMNTSDAVTNASNAGSGFTLTSSTTFSCSSCSSSTGGAVYGPPGITSITVSAGVATIAWAQSGGSPYGANQSITISGSSVPACNATFQLTNFTGTTFSAGSCTTISGTAIANGPPMLMCAISCNLDGGYAGFEAMIEHLQTDCVYVTYCENLVNGGLQEDSGADLVEINGWGNNGIGLWIGLTSENSTYHRLNLTNTGNVDNPCASMPTPNIAMGVAIENSAPKSVSDLSIVNTFLGTGSGCTQSNLPAYAMEIDGGSGTQDIGPVHAESFRISGLIVSVLAAVDHGLIVTNFNVCCTRYTGATGAALQLSANFTTKNAKFINTSILNSGQAPTDLLIDGVNNYTVANTSPVEAEYDIGSTGAVEYDALGGTVSYYPGLIQMATQGGKATGTTSVSAGSSANLASFTLPQTPSSSSAPFLCEAFVDFQQAATLGAVNLKIALSTASTISYTQIANVNGTVAAPGQAAGSSTSTTLPSITPTTAAANNTANVWFTITPLNQSNTLTVSLANGSGNGSVTMESGYYVWCR